MKEPKKILKNCKRQQEPIAIVGMGCRFPGEVNDPRAFWELLTQGRNAVTEVPADRWSLSKFYDPDSGKAGKIKNSKGGFVNNIDHFDPNFFGIFPSEAHRMDPQQRLLLEVTYQAPGRCRHRTGKLLRLPHRRLYGCVYERLLGYPDLGAPG